MNLTFTNGVKNYCEQIEKEDQGRRMWQKRFGDAQLGWRPVEPFEKGSSSFSDTEVPPVPPKAAVSYPHMFRDTVGDLGLAGGTPKRFGGRWDCTWAGVPPDKDPSKPPRVVKKGPHDCYCEIGFAAWSMAGKARTVNHGLRGAVERGFWTSAPGERALVWGFSGAEKRKALAQSKAAAANAEAMAKLDAQVAGAPSAAPGRS